MKQHCGFALVVQGLPYTVPNGRTHSTWHRLAPILAYITRSFLAIYAGLANLPSHRTTVSSGSSKRAKARDCFELQHLRVQRFGVACHGRGSYTAFRLAMDYAESVSR